MPVPVPYTPKKITGRNVLSTVRRVVSVNNGRRERSRSPLRVEQSTERDSPQSPDSDGVSLHVRGSESPAAQAVEESGDSDDELDWHMGKNRDTFQHMKRIIAALTDDPRHNFSLIKTPNSISIHKPGMLIQLMKDDGSIYRNVNVDKFNRPDFTRKPERVVKAVRAFGAMLFQIKWKNVQETDLVPLKIVKKKWPRFLLKFYKKHLNMSIFNMHAT